MKNCGLNAIALLLLLALSADSNEIEIAVDETGLTGHAWAVVRCVNRTAKISFGPADPKDLALIYKAVPSTNDYKTRAPTVTHSIRLNEEECRSMIKQVKRVEGIEYQLAVHNCTTAVLNVLKAGGVNIYSDQGGLKRYIELPFETPRALADELRRRNREQAQPPGKEPPGKETNRQMRWRCNWKGVLHPAAHHCGRPELGGSWEVAP